MRMLIRRRYVRRVAGRMVVGVRSGMVLMLGLRRERLGRGGRCPRPVVRPVAFIGAIHLQGRISSTQPEEQESHPPRSTRDDTKPPGTAGMIASARALIDHPFDAGFKFNWVFFFGERKDLSLCSRNSIITLLVTREIRKSLRD